MTTAQLLARERPFVSAAAAGWPCGRSRRHSGPRGRGRRDLERAPLEPGRRPALRDLHGPARAEALSLAARCLRRRHPRRCRVRARVWQHRLRPAGGSDTNPNELAAAVLPAIFVCAFVFLGERRPIMRWGDRVAGSLLLVALLMTGSPRRTRRACHRTRRGSGRGRSRALEDRGGGPRHRRDRGRRITSRTHPRITSTGSPRCARTAAPDVRSLGSRGLIAHDRPGDGRGSRQFPARRGPLRSPRGSTSRGSTSCWTRRKSSTTCT